MYCWFDEVEPHASSLATELSFYIHNIARLYSNNHIKHLINSSQGEYWRRTLCVYVCTATVTAFSRINTFTLKFTHTRTHTYLFAHLNNAHCLFISVISARLAPSSYLFLFQIMNFIMNPLHAYNCSLQSSAFPEHLAAAQIMFALNTAQCQGMVLVQQKGGDFC